MAQITAALVKELRDKTSAGMMDCKKALNETDGDLEAAVDWLRTKGIAKADKKAGRVAAEGLVAAKTKGTLGILTEVNSETDFVSRNEEFQGAVNHIADLSFEAKGDVEALAAATTSTGENVKDYLVSLVARIGENMSLRRTQSVSVETGTVTSYIHNAVAPGLGKIGVLVALESEGDPELLEQTGKKIAMHVAATSPLSLSVESLDPADIAKERAALVAEAKESGKPEAIIDKMVDGRMSKFYKESVLLEQVFVMDTDKSVAQFVEAEAKELGSPITLAGFARMELGAGIEKVEEDFAAEVAATMKG